ncbi:MAG: hypothetical protein JXA69_08275 [Phycisphaerae bacterium]|nr:hypothetical protein [Phycisphaerae bacterium]
MAHFPWLGGFGAFEWFDSFLPDFLLAFAFFTSVVYAVLSRRFEQQRPAVAMSAALGLALAGGLVWWEQVNGYSVLSLGPIAAGFAVIILAGVMYQAIKGIGGSWAGAGIALGASLIVGWTLGLDWPVDRQIVQSIITTTLIVGILAFLLHRRGHLAHALHGWSDLADARHDMSDLRKNRRVSKRLGRGLRHLKHEARHLHEHPEDAQDIMLQLKRMLPAEGWLTERMARLRAKAHFVRKGHVARIAEITQHIQALPAVAKRQASQELIARYAELELDQRLERLDKSVAENELRMRNLTRQAQADLQANNHQALSDVLGKANKLQHHNEKLFKLIDRTEKNLMAMAHEAAKHAQQVSHA